MRELDEAEVWYAISCLVQDLEPCNMFTRRNLGFLTVITPAHLFSFGQRERDTIEGWIRLYDSIEDDSIEDDSIEDDSIEDRIDRIESEENEQLRQLQYSCMKHRSLFEALVDRFGESQPRLCLERVQSLLRDVHKRRHTRLSHSNGPRWKDWRIVKALCNGISAKLESSAAKLEHEDWREIIRSVDALTVNTSFELVCRAADSLEWQPKVADRDRYTSPYGHDDPAWIVSEGFSFSATSKRCNFREDRLCEWAGGFRLWRCVECGFATIVLVPGSSGWAPDWLYRCCPGLLLNNRGLAESAAIGRDRILNALYLLINIIRFPVDAMDVRADIERFLTRLHPGDGPAKQLAISFLELLDLGDAGDERTMRKEIGKLLGGYGELRQGISWSESDQMVDLRQRFSRCETLMSQCMRGELAYTGFSKVLDVRPWFSRFQTTIELARMDTVHRMREAIGIGTVPIDTVPIDTVPIDTADSLQTLANGGSIDGRPIGANPDGLKNEEGWIAEKKLFVHHGKEHRVTPKQGEFLDLVHKAGSSGVSEQYARDRIGISGSVGNLFRLAPGANGKRKKSSAFRLIRRDNGICFLD